MSKIIDLDSLSLEEKESIIVLLQKEIQEEKEKKEAAKNVAAYKELMSCITKKS